MSIFLVFATFALGVLTGQTITKRANRKANSVSVDSFCELVADKIAQRIKGE